MKFEKSEAKRIFISSDWHFSHTNLCRGVSYWEDKDCCRDFSSIQEMNGTILDSINSEVGQDDILFHLGDFLFGPHKNISVLTLRERIRCKNLFNIFGNHDDWMKREEYKEVIEKTFVSVHEYLEIRVGQQKACLFHFPLRIWNEINKGAFALTGHSHGDAPYEKTVRGLDMGWDVWEKPISFFEIQEILNQIPYRKIHHDVFETK